MDKCQTRSLFTENAGIPVDWERFPLFYELEAPRLIYGIEEPLQQLNL